MALLSESKRKQYFKKLGLGEYDQENIRKLQRKYMRSCDVDGIYGPDTDKLLRHVYNCSKVKNFKPEEFRCPCGHCTGYPTWMKEVELQHIQTIRDHYDKPMTITSGLRCQHENRRVGGVPNSGHLTGYAVDFYMPDVTDTIKHRVKALKYIETLPNHKFTYGACMVDSDGYYRSASGMGNAMHTETKKPQVHKITNKIALKADEYAYQTNTKKADYETGKPAAAYEKALPEAYPHRDKWSAPARNGASCDVFVGTCIRTSGADKLFPRGLDDQWEWLKDSDKFKLVKNPTVDTVKDGDIITYVKSSGGGHICIVCDGKIKEAGYGHYYPKTTDVLKSRLSAKGKKWIKVYRLK